MTSVSRLALLACLLVGCGANDASSAPPSSDDAADVGAEDVGGVEVGSDDVGPEAEREAGAACGCSEFGAPVVAGNGPAVLNETSGLAASHKNPGVLYAHNDSGDSARFFAIDEKAQLLGQLNVQGATAIDWEDISVGPCGGTTCVFLGDVGDNAESRTDYALYLVEEPALDGKPFATMAVPGKKIPFAYPDGNHNCEALLVHPRTGEVFLVTKRATEDGGIYRFPTDLVAGKSVTLERVGAAKGTKGSLVTGGDISPCGDRILLRTYGAVLSWALGASVADAFAVAPKSMPVAKEAQGEAVAFRLDGRAYFTMSEGATQPLSQYACP